MDLHDNSRPNRADRRYKVTTIRNGKPQEQIVTREQLCRLDHNDIDVVISEPSRQVIVNPSNGQKGTSCRPRMISGLGVYVWDLLTDAVFAAGELVLLTSSPFMNTRVRRLRRAFGDSKNQEWFFRTSVMPYGIAINSDRVWRYIEVLAE
ncbi:MAG TPA: hypothetical protein VLI39_12780 [Sedimentisphaerales bacterium]|nr:hypothetical protein [Sedimentisphaerales bacterium]